MPGRDNLSRHGRRAYATSVTSAYALLAVAGLIGALLYGHLGLDSGWPQVLVGASGVVLTLGGSACAYFSARSLWLRELEFMWLVPLALTGYIATLRSEEHTSELQSREKLVCRLLLEKKNNQNIK